MRKLDDMMTRRQALARVAYLMGGALSASTVAGVLAGCDRGAGAAGAAWSPRTLSEEQGEMVLIMGEHILPETDTPGARAARVHEYIDAMLTDYYPAQVRQRFMTGLERTDAHARRLFGGSFLEISPEQQLALSQGLNRAAFRDSEEPSGALPAADPVLREGDVDRGDERALPVPDDGWGPEDVGRGAFFHRLKELVLVGYYTSELGATQELSVNPMGSWLADIPYGQVGNTWA